jgi:hypothetical protein
VSAPTPAARAALFYPFHAVEGLFYARLAHPASILQLLSTTVNLLQNKNKEKGGAKMAVNAIPLGSRLQLILITGMDDKGNPTYRTRSYSNVKPDASDLAVYNVGNALAGLQEHELDVMRRVNELILKEEEEG